MTIKECARKILLSVYYEQTTAYGILDDCQISISTNYVDGKPGQIIEANGILDNIFRNISSDNSLLINGFNYLVDKHLIKPITSRGAMAGPLYFGLHLTADGVDVVEGIEGGEDSKKRFSSLFNVTFSPKITANVDSLIKADVGNIVGIGGAISGKIDR